MQNSYAALCSPPRKFSTRYSDVRSEKVKMLIVVVLSVQFRKTVASHTYRLGTSWVWPKRLVTKCFGSLPMRQVPVSCRLKPGISGLFAYQGSSNSRRPLAEAGKLGGSGCGRQNAQYVTGLNALSCHELLMGLPRKDISPFAQSNSRWACMVPPVSRTRSSSIPCIDAASKLQTYGQDPHVWLCPAR
jgi:hypothetical protein